MGLKVLTLTDADLAEHCARLEKAITDAGFMPDVVTAIPAGGRGVANLIFKSLPHNEVSLIRRGRGRTKRRIATLIRRLPLWLRNALRIAEARYLVNDANHMSSVRIEVPAYAPDVTCVLVVDDAVDSGATIHAVVDELRRAYPTINFRTAAVTVTGRKVVEMPNYYLFHNQILIRFPWSIDS